MKPSYRLKYMVDLTGFLQRLWAQGLDKPILQSDDVETDKHYSDLR